MSAVSRYIAAACLLFISTLAEAGPAQVLGVRMWPAADNTRLVFDLSAPVEHKLFRLSNPDRIVIDLADASLAGKLPKLNLDKSVFSAIRAGRRDGDDLRVVLDLRTEVRPKSFALKPYQNYGHRLVVDLYDQRREAARNAAAPSKPATNKLRDVVIAIDAGHGGEDPGARGRKGTREKDVVLAISRKLAALVDKEPGMRAVLIRTGDYFIPLRGRMEKARRARADLFVSIHADAFTNPRARGSSVYILSQRGASSEAARWLAESENASDLIGGVSLDDKDDVLASVLLDLSQTATTEASLDVANQVLGNLRRVGAVHKREVQQAGFLVLKSPDMPSILVETAFISNPQEEAKLRSARHQRAMAAAILRGIRAYFVKTPPPGTLLAMRRHVIARGDTLSEIAERYNVSMDRLRSTNGIKGDMLKVGDVLRIPPGRDS